MCNTDENKEDEGIFFTLTLLSIAPSGHVQTIKNIMKDTIPSQEHQNQHQLQQEL